MKRGLIFLILTVLSFSIYAGKGGQLFTKLDLPSSTIVNTECYNECYSECASECNGDPCCERECDECCTDCCEPCEPPPVVKPPCTLVPPRVGRPPKPGYEPNPPHYDVTWECEEDQDIFTRPLFKKIEKEVPEVYVFKQAVPIFSEPELKPILSLMPMPRMEMHQLKSPLPLCYTSFIGRCHSQNLQEKMSDIGVNPFNQ